jgi:molybdopterin/thiamine biosynthesis adenylyltransferase
MPDVLHIADDDQYSRLRLIGWWRQELLTEAKVLVVGAGALGNEVVKNLALLGVGRIYLIDFDNIELSNLTRSVLFRRRDCGRPKAEVAAEAAQDINPDCEVTPWLANVITDVGLGVFRDVGVVIGCLDNREARLWVNRQCWKVGTPWIDGGIQEINGVVKTYLPPEGACYECSMTENDYRLINLRYSCPLLPREDILAGKVPTAPTIASMIGAWQVQEALKILHDLPVEGGIAHVYNGASNQVYTTRFQRKEDCLSHETFEDIVALPLQADVHTADDLFAAARERFPGEASLELVLDRDLVVALTCGCGEVKPIHRARAAVKLSEATCPKCGETMHPQMQHTIAAGADLASLPLRSLGVPPYDIVRVADGEREEYFALDGDRAEIMTGRVVSDQ